MITKAWNIVFVCIAALYSTNAQITGWTVPVIANAHSGPGAAAIEIAEDKAVGDTGTTLSATPTNPDTITSYTLLTAGTPFSVVSASGVLNLDSALDFETTTSYTLEVRAVDTNATPNSGTATITITVTDVNDNAPTFASSALTACVADGSTAGQSVTTLTATDPDTGDTITYSITSGNTNTDFQFSAAELQVNTAKTLDMATTASYTLGIRATDAASATGDTTLTVTVGGCSSSTVLGISIMVTLMALIVSLY